MNVRGRIPRAILRKFPQSGSFLDLGQQKLELLVWFHTGDLIGRQLGYCRFRTFRKLVEMPHVGKHDFKRRGITSQCFLSQRPAVGYLSAWNTRLPTRPFTSATSRHV